MQDKEIIDDAGEEPEASEPDAEWEPPVLTKLAAVKAEVSSGNGTDGSSLYS